MSCISLLSLGLGFWPGSCSWLQRPVACVMQDARCSCTHLTCLVSRNVNESATTGFVDVVQHGMMLNSYYFTNYLN